MALAMAAPTTLCPASAASASAASSAAAVLNSCQKLKFAENLGVSRRMSLFSQPKTVRFSLSLLVLSLSLDQKNLQRRSDEICRGE